jgi:hypothetical protein
MATSKNNRKKGRKRQQMHKKPVPDYVVKAEQERMEAERKADDRTRTWSFLGLILMIVGFVVAVMGYPIIGYPLTFVGAVIGMFTTSSESKHPRIVMGGYMVYCVLVAVLWITLLRT